MTTLITGGSKCGKSRLAEKLLDRFDRNKFYIAAMKPYGGEALAAIARHRRLRAGKGFETIEKYTALHELELPENSVVLLECMANLCANEMFSESGINDPTERIMSGIKGLCERTAQLVIVTNNVGSDGISYTPETNRYIEVMGRLNTLTAALSDSVIECVYGVPVYLKGARGIYNSGGKGKMTMITGGAFQGKTEYAKKRFDLNDGDILDCADCDIPRIRTAKCVRNYELAVRRLMEQGEDPLRFTEELSCDIVIMNEIGCGIIPLEKKEREWREMTGRAGCIIAERAEQAVRVCCGIAEVIK